jgi:TusA-related sulfurtransferase
MNAEMLELDIRGQVCPSCLLLTLREINSHHARLTSGSARLTVLIDSRDATTTIPQAVKNLGLSATIEKLADGYQVVIQRPEDQG